MESQIEACDIFTFVLRLKVSRIRIYVLFSATKTTRTAQLLSNVKFPISSHLCQCYLETLSNHDTDVLEYAY